VVGQGRRRDRDQRLLHRKFHRRARTAGWASVDRLPVTFKLLHSRTVEPHSLEGDSGSIYLWVEALDEGNRPSGVPRAYRLPYSGSLAEKTDKAASEIGRRACPGRPRRRFGSGEGGLLDAAREFITPNA